MGNKTTGKYEFSFTITIFAGHGGYYALMHNNIPSNRGCGLAVHFGDDGTAYIHAGSNTATEVAYAHGAFIKITHRIDLDNDSAELLFNDVSVKTWK